jgi:methylase of polypeptide subunit release factors
MAAATAIRFPDARVTATDIDPAMVSAAEKRLAGLPNATARRPGSPQRLVSAAELGDELRRLGFDARVESFGRGQVMRFTARKR